MGSCACSSLQACWVQAAAALVSLGACTGCACTCCSSLFPPRSVCAAVYCRSSASLLGRVCMTCEFSHQGSIHPSPPQLLIGFT